MRTRLAAALLSATLPCALLPAAPAAAQEINARVGKLESEMRAVQRKVFPGGGGGAYLQPDIAPDQAAPERAPGTPASSPVADLSQRVSSLEGQMQSLTGQIEQNQYRLRQLEDQFNAYRRATDARLAAGAQPAPAAGFDNGSTRGDRRPAPDVSDATIDGPAPASAPRSSTGRGSTRVSAETPAPVAAMEPTRSDPARTGRAASVDRPDTGVPDEDAYLYGYRLWQAKLYPEAEAQLKQVVTDYPKSRRASYAQNLLGRAYLDDGKSNSAATAFYESYKKFPDGERAPDSLLYLAGTLMKLNKPADACKVYGELNDVYGAKISATMKADIAKGRVAAHCS